MSSTVVVDPAAGLLQLAASLEALRQEADALADTSAADPAFAAAYRLLSRDLFDLTVKSRAMAWSNDGNTEDLAGLLRVNELKTADQVVLLEKMARLLAEYVTQHGGRIRHEWAVEAVAKRMPTTIDESDDGLTYAEQLGLVERDRLDLIVPAALS